MVKNSKNSELPFSIIDAEMTVKAMRDSGYKSTTHALAELIDNSIESEATTIEVFGISHKDPHTGRFVLTELAVLDNGVGMAKDTLRGSLRYGHGTRRKRGGIGRFGIGLPNSSMSQAKKVDIWSWQSGIPNAYRAHLYLDEVEKGESEIAEPIHDRIPVIYEQCSECGFEDSGTLVVWRDLDQVEWQRASTTFKHTEFLIGRIYRRFLAKRSERLHPEDTRNSELGPKRSITLIPVQSTNGKAEREDKEIVRVRPNDPLYLMSGTSCPEQFGSGPMFTELEGSPFFVDVSYKGQKYSVRVRATYVRSHARNHAAQEANWPTKFKAQDAGNLPWGQHAGNNTGVSIVRAHREIHLDDRWTQTETTERWWKIEVDFPTALDELFGVTNDKQGAMKFQRIASYDWRKELLPGEKSPQDVRRRMESSGDPRYHLLDLHMQINKAITVMRTKIDQIQTQRKVRYNLDEKDKTDEIATDVIKERKEEGHRGESDERGEVGSEDEHREEQVQVLVKKHNFDEEEANRRVNETLVKGNRVRLIESVINSPTFFDVESQPNVLQVVLNKQHPVYPLLLDNVILEDIDDLSEDELRERLVRAGGALRILLYAWSRYEEEQTDREKRKVRDTRLEWGKYAEEFFERGESFVPPTDLV